MASEGERCERPKALNVVAWLRVGNGISSSVGEGIVLFVLFSLGVNDDGTPRGARKHQRGAIMLTKRPQICKASDNANL